MEKKPIENISAAVTDEELIIKTTNTSTGNIEQVQVSSEAEAISVATTSNVVKTRH